MVAGIVLVSFRLGKTMSVLGSHGLFDGAPVYQLPHLALFGGVIIYLLVDLAFRWRLKPFRTRPPLAAWRCYVATADNRKPGTRGR